MYACICVCMNTRKETLQEKRRLEIVTQLIEKGVKYKHQAELYEMLLNTTPIIPPKIFQVKLIANEPQNQLKLRERTALEKFKMYLEFLKVRDDSNKDNFKSFDQHMEVKISNHSSHTLLDKTMKLWKEDYDKEKHPTWFSNYEYTFKYTLKSGNSLLTITIPHTHTHS